MKTNKVLFGSFLLAGLVSACTNDEIVIAEQDTLVDLSERTQIDLTFGLPETGSRMAPSGLDVAFTSNDLLGAVLVDGGYSDRGVNNVNWTIVDGHVGNNKWAYNPEANNKKGAFETAGTTSVGAWLFYTKYNELMTTTRDGVKFSFPQIQEGAKDFAYLANNNANFMITPILAIDGYEGSKLNLELKYASVYNYLQMKFDFSGLEDADVTSVQKIIVKAEDEDGNTVKFPTYGRVVNKNLPVARLSLKDNDEEMRTPDLTGGGVHVDDQNMEIEMKYNEIRDKYYEENSYGGYKKSADNKNISTNDVELWGENDDKTIEYKPIVESADPTRDVEYLVVDFETEHADVTGKGGLAVVDGLFDAFMLMPAGVYSSITFEIYTNAGVYRRTVNSRNAYVENDLAEGEKLDDKLIGEKAVYLRSNVGTVLSDIQDKTKEESLEYLKVSEKIEGTVVTKTADLINFIKGITSGGIQNVTVITQTQIGDKSNGVDDDEFAAHTAAVINKDVMAAIDEKMKTYQNLQLVIESVDPITVIGGTAEEPLAIHDITFKNSCELKSGYVAVTKESGSTELIIPEDQKMLVKSGVNLTLDNSLQEYDEFAAIEIESGANVTINNHLWIDDVVNDGNILINNELDSESITNDGTITSKRWLKVKNDLTNEGTVTADGTFEIGGVLTNSLGYITSDGNMTVKGQMKNNGLSTITNNGTFTLLDEGNESTNNGTINNNSEFVIESDLTTGGEINNAKNSSIILDKTAALNNKVSGVINNEGSMRCATGTGANKINNLGTINAKKGSRTYITTNSSADEKENGTNSVTMGTIVLENRNEDMSVTVGAQQGYIQYAVPAETTELKYEQGDKFNKVILTGNTSIVAPDAGANRVKYVVVDAAIDLTLPETATVQEIEFNANTVLYAWPVVETVEDAVVAKSAKLAWIKVAKDVEVTIPTENAIYIEDVTNELTAGEKKFQSMTYADIDNEGEIIVGGDLYSTLPESITTNNGKFSSGDGEKTAFHWDMNENAPETEGYVLIGKTAKVTSEEGLNGALVNASVETIKLPAGEFNADLYQNAAAKGTLTITGEDGTVLKFKNQQVRAGLYDELVIENCTIGKMTDKKWGHLVFGSSDDEKGIYTIRNCTFNGVGTQGIYINEKVAGATYNIENCTFDGDFGSEGAITIQAGDSAGSRNVAFNVNVTGCKFNNIPATSHKIAVLFTDTAWTLNTDVADDDVYWRDK